MNKKNLLLAATTILISLGVSNSSFAEEQSGTDKVLRQLGRGMGNVTTGIFEIPANILDVQAEDGEVAGITYGLVRGVWRFTVREVVGVFEIVTVPIVRMKPIIEPEWSSEGGPVSVIYHEQPRYPTATETEWKVNPPRLNREKKIPESLPPELEE